MPLALLIAYVATLIVLASLRSLPVRSAIIQRLRAFFPSWRFFDDIGDMPVLWLRVQRQGAPPEDFEPWQPCLPTPKRSGSMLVWNPDGNLRLAYDSLLMHLLTDADEQSTQPARTGAPTRLAACVSYQLTEQLVAFQLRRDPQAASIVRYQFKVTSVTAGAALHSGEDVIVSPVLSR